jgi:hypothetical protein
MHDPNAAVLLLPAGLLIAWRYRKERRLYLLATLGALPAALLYHLGRKFYDERPAYMVHKDWELSFDASAIRWNDLQFLDDINPILWGKGFLVPVVIVVLIGVLVWRKRLDAALALGTALVLLVVSFGMAKVHEGTANVFFPWSRMFLAIPFLLVLFIAQLKVRDTKLALWCMPLMAAGFFGYKSMVFHDAVERQVDPTLDTKVEMAEFVVLERHCQEVQRYATNHGASLLVVNWGRYKHLTTYGCPCLMPGFPVTIEPALDRRTWLLREQVGQVHANVLFTGMGDEHFAGLPQGAPQVERVADTPLLYLVKHNKEDLVTLLNSLQLGLRPL